MKRNTFTFEIEPDNQALLDEVAKRGRGVRSKVMNQVIREVALEVLRRWDGFHFVPPRDTPEGSRS